MANNRLVVNVLVNWKRIFETSIAAAQAIFDDVCTRHSSNEPTRDKFRDLLKDATEAFTQVYDMAGLPGDLSMSSPASPQARGLSAPPLSYYSSLTDRIDVQHEETVGAFNSIKPYLEELPTRSSWETFSQILCNKLETIGLNIVNAVQDVGRRQPSPSPSANEVDDESTRIGSNPLSHVNVAGDNLPEPGVRSFSSNGIFSQPLGHSSSERTRTPLPSQQVLFNQARSDSHPQNNFSDERRRAPGPYVGTLNPGIFDTVPRDEVVRIMVNQFDPETTTEKLAKYLSRFDVSFECVKLSTRKMATYATFVITTTASSYDTIASPDTWPSDVYIREFRGRPRFTEGETWVRSGSSAPIVAPARQTRRGHLAVLDDGE